MADRTEHHISSAVVSVLPGHEDAVARTLAAMPDTEVHHTVSGKIVIVMEGASTGALGQRLAGIALMDHVLSANMVYEVVDREIEEPESPGDGTGTGTEPRTGGIQRPIQGGEP